jgi:hypothetical protein
MASEGEYLTVNSQMENGAAHISCIITMIFKLMPFSTEVGLQY